MYGVMLKINMFPGSSVDPVNAAVKERKARGTPSATAAAVDVREDEVDSRSVGRCRPGNGIKWPTCTNASMQSVTATRRRSSGEASAGATAARAESSV